MQVWFVAFETARAYFAESYARAVVGVDVCGNFEYEACKLFFIGVNHAFLCFGGAGVWCYFDKAVKQLFNAKIV